MRRYYTPHPLHEGDSLTLEQEESKHLIRVMRAQPGDAIELVNGRGFLAQAILEPNGSLKLQKVSFEKPCSCFIIAQAIPKVNRLDTIVEKSTELGMDELWFFPGELSEKKEISPTLLKRLELIAIAAMKQCGRLYLPKILLQPALGHFALPSCPAYFGDLAATDGYHGNESELIFFIGPESGFSENEESYLRSHAKGIRLHKNILRTDTAALCFLSQTSTIPL